MIKQLTIDPEFKNLIPPLSADEFAQLEQNIINEGCRDRLVIWEGKIIDGHNRYEICHKNQVYFETKEEFFDERGEVIEWIIKNQFGRRNLPPYERSVLALRLEDEIKVRAKEKQIRKPKDSVPQKSAEQTHTETRKELAKLAGVSHDTISKVKIIEEKATPEQKEALRTGEKKINRVYREVQEAETGAKVCKKCGETKQVSEFYDDGDGRKRLICKSCHNARSRERDCKNIKGEGYKIAPELKKITEAEIIGDLYNVDRVIEYTIDDLDESLGSIIDTFCRQAKADLVEHKNLLNSEKNIKKITANLSRVIEAVNTMIGDIANE